MTQKLIVTTSGALSQGPRLGTHTHVPTADEQILPPGTAFQCDVGMCGPYNSVLGRRIERVLATTITFVPTQFDVADRDLRLAGAIVEVNPETGRASTIQRVMWPAGCLPVDWRFFLRTAAFGDKKTDWENAAPME